jgi:hypothetical protein
MSVYIVPFLANLPFPEFSEKYKTLLEKHQ